MQKAFLNYVWKVFSYIILFFWRNFPHYKYYPDSWRRVKRGKDLTDIGNDMNIYSWQKVFYCFLLSGAIREKKMNFYKWIFWYLWLCLYPQNILNIRKTMELKWNNFYILFQPLLPYLKIPFIQIWANKTKCDLWWNQFKIYFIIPFREGSRL